MSDFLVGLGLMLLFEGLIYGGMPGSAKRMAVVVQRIPEGTLRLVGLASMVFGLGIVWLVRG